MCMPAFLDVGCRLAVLESSNYLNNGTNRDPGFFIRFIQAAWSVRMDFHENRAGCYSQS